jgi:hypothetical protein
MKIKNRIIGEYATKRCFFDLKKADYRYWKLINYALDRWNELKEVLRVQTRAEVAQILLDR